MLARLGRGRRGSDGATRIDLVEGDAEAGSEFLLNIGAGLVLGEEVLLEDVVLVFGEAGLDIAAGLLGRGRCSRRSGAAGIHVAASSDNAARAGGMGRRSEGGGRWWWCWQRQ